MKQKILLLLFLLIVLFSAEKSNAQGCDFYWPGFQSYSVTSSSITLNWAAYEDGGVGNNPVSSSYVVYMRLNDYDYGVSPWANVGNISTTSFTSSGLDSNTTYEFMIQRYCNGNPKDTSSPQFSITTASGGATANMIGPFYLSASNITGTSADINYYIGYPPPGVRIDYGQVYYQEKGSSTWMESSRQTSSINDNIGILMKSTITGLKAGASYDVIAVDGYTLNPGQSYATSGVLRSATSFNFKTPGPCGSVGGNYTAPAINNDDKTDFYSGTITSSSSVTQSTVTHIFKSPVIFLNPGFLTTISGTGGLIVRTFDPTTCANAKTSGTTKTHTVSDLNNLTAEAVAKEDIQEQKKGIKVYPNPTTGILNIHSDAADEIIKQVAILSEAGQTVLSEKGSKGSIDISHLSNALYIYKVETNQGSYTGKVIKK